MSTAFEVGGRPIISFTGDWDNNNGNNNFSATSTVVLDPAAFLANWKKQIQGKYNIPINQQRLTFASNHCPYPGINLFSWSSASQDQSANRPVAGDFVKCLQSWQAILRSEKRNIARLLDPEVLIESDKLPSDLKSKTAEEIRDLGIPCSVYYLSFDKCVLALRSRSCQGEAQSCKEVSNLCIKVDKDFQLKEFEVDLYGHLSKSSHPLHFQYHFNGRHLAAHLSMLEQTAQYREGQKVRDSLKKGINTADKLVDESSTEPLHYTDRTSALVRQTPSRVFYLPGSNEQELTAIISSNFELRGIIIPVIILDARWERSQRFFWNGVNERSPLPRDSSKNREKEATQTEQWNPQCLPTMMNHLSEAKTPEFPKKKGMLSAKSKKSKGSCHIESQTPKPEQEDSSNFQTDRVNGCSSTKQPADSSKSDDTSKKSSKKKKKKKGKHNPKNSGSDTPVLILKECSEESSLASSINVTGISGSEHIPICGNGHTNSLKNNIKTSDLEMCTIPKGEATDGLFSCANDLLCQTSAFLPQESSAEVSAASTQDATSNTLTEGPIHRIFDNSNKIIKPTILCTEAIDIPGSVDGEETSLNCYSEVKDCLGFETGSCSMNNKGSVGVPSDIKCGTVTKGRRVSDSHSIGNGTRLISTNLDLMSTKSTFKAGSSSNGHLCGARDRVHDGETGNTNGIISVDSHDKNKHISKVGRSRETQPYGKKVSGGKKVAGNNGVLAISANGSTSSCGTPPKGETTDGHFSCAKDLSSQISAFLSRETSADVFAPSIQNFTSNALTEGPIHRIFENSKNITNLNGMFSKSSFKAGGSSNGHLHGGMYNSETGNTSDIFSVDSHDRNKHIPKVGRSKDTQPDNKKVAGGKKVAGNNCGVTISSSGSTNSCGIGNVHNRVGKENPHSVWQKVQKNTMNGHIHESGGSDYIQLPSTLDSQNALLVVNLNSEKKTAIQISPKKSQEYGACESNHSKHKISDSEIYLEHGDFWNRIASHDVQCRVKVQEDSHRSQHGRDDNSVWSGDRKTLGIIHTDVTETGKDLEENITGCCRSEMPIQSCQTGNLDFSYQTNHPGRLPAAGSYISHQNVELHDTDQTNKWKSCSAPSTSCRHGDELLSNDFSFASSSARIQGQVNRIFPLSRISNSADKELLPTNNQGDQMTSAVHISEAQREKKQEIKTADSRIKASSENDIDHHFNMQHATQLDVPVELKGATMVMASTPDTGAVATQYMDIENNVHKGASENYKLHASSNSGLKSILSVLETVTSNHVEQTNAVENECFCDVSCKCLSHISASVSSSNAELTNMAQVISNSISASYESQLASESITRALGSPLAEFEKVLNSVSPEIEPLPHADKCSAHSEKLGITNLVCRCQIADIPLKNIWHWFEEPGNYGLEVKAEDFRHTGKLSVGGLFRAYFVPYLSGIQLFRFSASPQSCHKCAITTARQENNEEINKFEDSYLSHFANLPILSTLLPKPHATEKTTAHVCSYSVDTSNISSDAGNHSCSTLLKYSGHSEMEILFEYFESEQPQQRRPMLEKIKELTGIGSKSQVLGDPHILESINLRDLHPASWFSVAWYPIYRIPEGQLRAAFLTYHSLGHFIHRDSSPSTLGGDIGSCIVAPVVGLQSYNAQAEGWFVPKKQFASLKANISVNPLDVLRERLKTLEETASVMARGCAKKDASSVSSKQSDYDFFLLRRK